MIHFSLSPSPLERRDGPRHTADSRLYISLYKHTLNAAASRHRARTVYKLLRWGYVNSAVSPPLTGSAAPLGATVAEFYLAAALITALVMTRRRPGSALTWGCRWCSDGEVEQRGGGPAVREISYGKVALNRKMNWMVQILCGNLTLTAFMPWWHIQLSLEQNGDPQVWSWGGGLLSRNFVPTFSNDRRRDPWWKKHAEGFHTDSVENAAEIDQNPTQTQLEFSQIWQVFCSPAGTTLISAEYHTFIKGKGRCMIL